MEYKKRACDVRKDILEERSIEMKTAISSGELEKDVTNNEELEEAYEKLIVWMLW